MISHSYSYLLSHSLAWALLHSLWQGAIVFGLLFAVLKALGGLSAKVKYILSFTSLAIMVGWFLDTWVGQFRQLKSLADAIAQQFAAGAATVQGTGKYLLHMDATGPDLIDQLRLWLEHNSASILSLYCAGLAFMSVRVVIDFLRVKTLRAQGVEHPGGQLFNILQRGVAAMEISIPVQLLVSARVTVPMMVGVLKPLILLPVATVNQMSADEVEAILLHELAHIKRHDYLLNFFQVAAETVLFFNPFVWLVSGIIRRERELCCDDLVIACTAKPLPYARALAMLETHRLNARLSMAATGHKNLLLNRIKRIMEMKKQNISYSQLGIVALAIVTVIISVAAFTPSFAQKGKAGKNDTIHNKKTYAYTYVTVDSNGKKKVVNKVSSDPLDGNETEDNSNLNINISITDDSSGLSRKVIREIALAAKDAAAAFANIDHKKLDEELAKAEKEIESVDWEGVKAEINKGIAEIDRQLSDPKLHREIKVEVKKALNDAKRELEDAKRELAKSNIAIAVAKDGEIETVSGSNDYESMLSKMEKEGLLDRSSKFSVSKEDQDLYINGKKQPQDVLDRYKSYLNAKKVNIKGKKGDLNISVEN